MRFTSKVNIISFFYEISPQSTKLTKLLLTNIYLKKDIEYIILLFLYKKHTYLFSKNTQIDQLIIYIINYVTSLIYSSIFYRELHKISLKIRQNWEDNRNSTNSKHIKVIQAIYLVSIFLGFTSWCIKRLVEICLCINFKFKKKLTSAPALQLPSFF